MYGCELDDDGTLRGFWQYGYDGEDVISFDLNTKTWTEAHDKAVTTKQEWESQDEAAYVKAYLENECIGYRSMWVTADPVWRGKNVEEKLPSTPH
ncbi:hypothetical protein MHYP_G00004780 [Metynnis hypsauchen]